MVLTILKTIMKFNNLIMIKMIIFAQEIIIFLKNFYKYYFCYILDFINHTLLYFLIKR